MSESLGKLPPQAIDLEETVIGSILIHKPSLIEVVEFLRPEHFYSDAHKEIYNAAFCLWIADEPINMHTVVHYLRHNGKLEAVGGASHIAELATKVHSSAHIVHHARILMEMAFKRNLIHLASRIHHDAYEDSTDVFELFDDIEQEFKGISTLVPNRRDVFAQYIEAHRFDPSKHPQDDDTLLYLNNTPVGSRDNIVSITGKAKSRKTVVARAMATSMFKPDGFLGFSSMLPHDAVILHIDTEQGYKHYWHSVDRIFKDASTKKPDRFISIHTRDADIPMRLQLINHLVEMHKPSVMIVDGVTDLVYDINDQGEATKLGELFLQLSSKHRMLIIVVIHTTKTTGFMTGAVGTIFEKKSETVIKVEIMEGNPMASDISCQFSRNAPFPTFSIEADKNGDYSVINASEVAINGEKPYEHYTKERHLEFLLHIFDKKQVVSIEKLQSLIKKQADPFMNNPISPQTAKKWIERYRLEMLVVDAPGGVSVALKPVKSLHDVQLKLDADKEKDDMPF